MNRCSSCQREFGYWEVWRSSSFKGVKCSSCGKRHSAGFFGGLPGFVAAVIPILVAVYFPPATALLERLSDRFGNFIGFGLIYLPLYFLLRFLLPLFPLLGRKPEDVE